MNHLPVYALGVKLSVVVITYNEEANLARTLASVATLVRDGAGEIIVVDSGSTDRTVEIAKSFGAKVFVEDWKGYAAQKNSAIAKAAGDWILSLDGDEEGDPEFCRLIPLLTARPQGLTESELTRLTRSTARGDSSDAVEMALQQEEAEGNAPAPAIHGYRIARQNHFLGRWIRHGGFWPDPKLRLFRRGQGHVEERSVHEVISVNGRVIELRSGFLIHYSYPTLSDYIEHMNRYSSLAAEMAVAEGRTAFSVMNVVVRPWLTFFYNYILRLGFLDGREGLLLHLYHAVYVSWKYAKLWERGRAGADSSRTGVRPE